MLEYEKKIMLTEEEYFTIVKLMCKDLPTQTQTNYYFDNDNMDMNKKGITCRIRAKDGNYKATLKNHNIGQLDCSFEVELVEKKEFDPKIFDVFGVHYQGNLVTDRVVIHKDSFCEMVLDRNTYLGYTDFELEIEYYKGNEKRAEELLKKVSKLLVESELLTNFQELLLRVGRGKSKSQRFFERLKNIK